jgi:lipid II:glycine glycyltransferase (peptidoglycan interpeptide bridge formation enzyme)
MKNNIKIDEELNEIDEMIDILNMCRLDYYKLYEKDFKVASIRLRHNLEKIIQTSKQMKRDALKYRKEIEKREDVAKQEARDAGYYK